jgi:phosphatidylglycerol:prolipoprotein diacylglycerol transferase
MYPNLYYAFKDLFGVEWSVLRIVNSFGFFVAISFVLAAVILTKELKRKSKEGLLHPTDMQVMVGQPATAGEILLNFLFGFLFGYKLLGFFFMDKSATEDPQQYIFSGIGSWPAGIALGLLFAFLKWYDKNKQKLPKPEKRTVRIWPHDRVGEITIIALVFGLIGAKVFDTLENWNRFVQDPSTILSVSGLTFYGGLICAAAAIWFYARKHKIGFWHLNDSAAPALMLAYGTGRIGCQVSGDGDWGIFNAAYRSLPEGGVAPGTPEQFNQALQTHAAFFSSGSHGTEHTFFSKPGWLNFLPDWMFAYDFPHNVNDTGVRLANCVDAKYCDHLPVPVFPTSFYETLMCIVLFALLWAVRKKLTVPGTLFALYLMVNGLERFMIEKIRVNEQISFLGFRPTQAEVISTLLFLSGLGLWIYLRKTYKGPRNPQPVPNEALNEKAV